MKDGYRARDDVAKRGGQGPPIGVTKISQVEQHNTASIPTRSLICPIRYQGLPGRDLRP